jgi:hypothetical protein
MFAYLLARRSAASMLELNGTGISFLSFQLFAAYQNGPNQHYPDLE